MTYIAWAARIIVFLVIAGFLHYTLPDRDIVRIVSTYEERQDFGGLNSIFWSRGSAGAGDSSINRDVLFIQTVRADGRTMVYRNEDTGWGWPPYFKFNTADLQTEAADAISTRDNPQWYAMRHYGWRSNLFSIFPNALSMRAVESPDVRLIPHSTRRQKLTQVVRASNHGWPWFRVVEVSALLGKSTVLHPGISGEILIRGKMYVR